MTHYKSILVFSALSMLVACSDVKKEIGLGRQSPDEFAVVTRAPLSMPPSFELTPPKPGATRPQEATTRDAAKELVFTEPSQTELKAASSAESALLQQAGASEANPEIRNIIDRELGQVDVKDPYIGRRLLFWKDDPKAQGDVVDPVEETKRLREMEKQASETAPAETPAEEE